MSPVRQVAFLPRVMLPVGVALSWAALAEGQLRFAEVAQERGLDFELRAERYIVPPVVGDMVIAMQLVVGNGAAVGDYDADGDLDVYLLGHLGQPNRLFRNDLIETGQKGFSDVTEPPLDDLGISRVAHFVDLDADGWLDILLVNDHLADEFRDGRQGNSRDNSRGPAGSAGYGDGGRVGGSAYFSDAGYDFEGPATTAIADPDATSPSRIFRNRGDGTFEDVTKETGFLPDGMLRCGASLADFDGNGYLDVFVTNWSAFGGSGPAGLPGRNTLYRNDALRFAPTTADVGPERLDHDSFTAIFTDFDDDAHQDIYIAVDHREDVFYLGGVGSLGGAASFSENYADQVNTLHLGNDMGVAAADFDDDDDLDLYATNITDEVFGNTKGNVFYVNALSQTGELLFWDEALERGVFDTAWGWGTAFFDPDNDGDLDLIATGGFDDFISYRDTPESPIVGTPSFLFENDGTGHFQRVRGTDLDLRDDSRALVVFDYDRDGDQDVLITNQNQPVRLFENTTEADNHYLTVELRPDHLAAGARVYATIDGVRKRRDVLVGDSYLAGTPREAHFGLGHATKISELTIKWANGTTSRRDVVPIDTVLLVDYDEEVRIQSANQGEALDAGPPHDSAGTSAQAGAADASADALADEDGPQAGVDVRRRADAVSRGCTCSSADPGPASCWALLAGVVVAGWGRRRVH